MPIAPRRTAELAGTRREQSRRVSGYYGEEKLARLAESSDSDLAEDAQLLLESLRMGEVTYPDDP